MTPILEIHKLLKRYPGVTAVDHIDLSVLPGICLGLLGPNGAGKTTTIEMIEGVIAPTSGRILYKGGSRTRRFKEEVGIQFQATATFAFLSVKETLETFRAMYKNPLSIEELTETCRLEDILERDNERISGGQRQRLMLALALVNDPDLLFLDEPTTGLDPQARHHLWDIVRKIKKSGKTLILTTHYMEEAQILCDEIAIIDMGKIIVRGATDALIKEHCAGVTVTLPKSVFERPAEQLFPDGEKHCETWKCVETENSYEFLTVDVNGCLETLLKNGVDLSRITIRSQNLEDLFLKLTGRRLRD